MQLFNFFSLKNNISFKKNVSLHPLCTYIIYILPPIIFLFIVCVNINFVVSDDVGISIKFIAFFRTTRYIWAAWWNSIQLNFRTRSKIRKIFHCYICSVRAMLIYAWIYDYAEKIFRQIARTSTFLSILIFIHKASCLNLIISWKIAMVCSKQSDETLEIYCLKTLLFARCREKLIDTNWTLLRYRSLRARGAIYMLSQFFT